MSNVKNKLKYDVIFSCLDVLSRANATVSSSDPILASDITNAIESLSNALQTVESPDDTKKIRKKNSDLKHIFNHDDVIVDVLTNEILYKRSKK